MVLLSDSFLYQQFCCWFTAVFGAMVLLNHDPAWSKLQLLNRRPQILLKYTEDLMTESIPTSFDGKTSPNHQSYTPLCLIASRKYFCWKAASMGRICWDVHSWETKAAAKLWIICQTVWCWTQMFKNGLIILTGWIGSNSCFSKVNANYTSQRFGNKNVTKQFQFAAIYNLVWNNILYAAETTDLNLTRCSEHSQMQRERYDV